MLGPFFMLALKELPVTWSAAFKIWWSITWRWLLFLALGFPFLFWYVATSGAHPEELAILFRWAALLIGVPLGVWIVRSVLRCTWGDFRIALVRVKAP